MTLRLALSVDRARVSGLWHGGFLSLTTVAWLAAAASHPGQGAGESEGGGGGGGSGGGGGARPLWWAVACLVEPLSSGAFLLFFQQHLVPIAKPYQVNKFNTISVLALGAFVASATGGVDPSACKNQRRKG
jgi:hypothetical protein